MDQTAGTAMRGIPSETFNGNPCRVCDGTLRFAKTGKCVPCRKKVVARHLTPERRKANKAKYKGRYKQRTRTQKLLDISHETFAELLAGQNARCTICGKKPKRRLHIDHCHSTGKFRALLCNSCNTGLGMFRDNPAILRAAIQYLKTHAWDL